MGRGAYSLRIRRCQRWDADGLSTVLRQCAARASLLDRRRLRRLRRAPAAADCGAAVRLPVVAASMNERPSKITPLSICSVGVWRSPFTRPGAWISIERFALMLPTTVPWMMTSPMSISASTMRALADHEHVVGEHLALEPAVDPDRALERELAFERRATPEQRRDLAGRLCLAAACTMVGAALALRRSSRRSDAMSKNMNASAFSCGVSGVGRAAARVRRAGASTSSPPTRACRRTRPCRSAGPSGASFGVVNWKFCTLDRARRRRRVDRGRPSARPSSCRRSCTCARAR